jgi:MurNAc alpha-1-phosphate uridylyltransferase
LKVMLLAAGRGERMRPLTDTVPKPLLCVAGKPLIVHLIERLVAEGFQQLVVNHAWQGAQIEQRLGNGGDFGATIEYSSEPEGALETGGGIRRALPLLGEDPFLAVNADIWTDFPFGRLAIGHESLAHLVLVDNPDHNPDGDFSLSGSRVHDGEGLRLTFSGIGVYRPELFNEAPGDRFPLAPILFDACRRDLVSGEYYHGEWCDIGTPERLQTLDRRIRGDETSAQR